MKEHWRVVSAKNEGITPGFTIVERRAVGIVLKFDPPCESGDGQRRDVILVEVPVRAWV